MGYIAIALLGNMTFHKLLRFEFPSLIEWVSERGSEIGVKLCAHEHLRS